MATPNPTLSTDEISAMARAGADSVFGYVERTAEPVADGVRWQTLSYEETPQFNPTLDGVAGIGLFLSDYYRFTGNAAARELARGGLGWCASPERRAEPWWQYVDNDSLAGGRGGVALAWLRLGAATGDDEALVRAREVGNRILGTEPGTPTAWGPAAADFYYGAAGTGIALVRLWEVTGEERYLDGAIRYGRWLGDVATRDGAGVHWPRRGDFLPDFCHGIAGIGYFLLLLHAATRGAEGTALAREVAETLTRHAVPDRGGLNWGQVRADGTPVEPLKCQWCIGAPGIGLFWAKGYDVLRDTAYLRTAESAGETTYAHGDVRQNAGQCHGLAGSGELFIELYRLTGEPRWRERAHDFAVQALRYRTTTEAGEAWLTDTPGCTSPDFPYGAAGVGHFFLRLAAPARFSWRGYLASPEE